VRKKFEESNQFSKHADPHRRVRRAQQQPRHFLRRALEDIDAVYCLQDIASLQQRVSMSKVASFAAVCKV
jgi:DNA-binding phage protein